MPARQVVEEIERDADVLRRGAEVRVELGDVARLGGDELLLLGGLGMRRAPERLRQSAEHPNPCRALEQFAPSDRHGCTSTRAIAWNRGLPQRCVATGIVPSLRPVKSEERHTCSARERVRMRNYPGASGGGVRLRSSGPCV